jgi:citrate lyase subunit beta/citryl-CoA lyase
MSQLFLPRNSSMATDMKTDSLNSPDTSYLFVPGTHPQRFEKALNSGADNVIIDLEDAVSVEEKGNALENTLAALRAGLSRPVFVRVNTIDSPWFGGNVKELVELALSGTGSLKGIILPKVEDASPLESLRAVFPENVQIVGLIETAVGLHHAVKIAAAKGLTRLAVGAVDLSEDLGAENGSAIIDFAYAQVVIASRLSKIRAPLASPPMALRSPNVIETNARRLRGMGLGGSLCIHPDQVAPIHSGFAPTQHEVEWATRVMDSIGGAVQVNGEMVDRPVREKAARILTEAGRRQL